MTRRARLRGWYDGLARRDRRALFLGFLVVAPALAWMGLVRPWFDRITSIREVVAVETALLQREQALLRDAPTLPQRLDQANIALAGKAERLVPYGNLALAEAAVTRRMEASARASQALLLEVRSLAAGVEDEAPAGLVPIRLAIRAESDFQGILELLHAIETDPLLFRVIGVSMRPQESPDVLTLEAIVEAYAPAEPIASNQEGNRDPANGSGQEPADADRPRIEDPIRRTS